VWILEGDAAALGTSSGAKGRLRLHVVMHYLAMTSRPWGSQRVTACVLIALGVVAAVAAWRMPAKDIPIYLGSGAFFHIALWGLAFLVLYFFAALFTLTLKTGGPPPDLSTSGVSFGKVAADTVEGLQQLTAHVAGLLAVSRSTQDALERLADGSPARPAVLTLVEKNRASLTALDRSNADIEEALNDVSTRLAARLDSMQARRGHREHTERVTE